MGTIPLPYPSPLNVAARYVVVAIPNNTEFFIGKNRLTLIDIPDRIRQQIGDLPTEQRTVSIKGEPGVTYETLSAAMRTIRKADVYRIEVVPIPK